MDWLVGRVTETWLIGAPGDALDDGQAPALLTDGMAVITVGLSGLEALAATQSGLLSG